MPGRPSALGLPRRRAETVQTVAAALPGSPGAAGVDPGAVSDMGLALRVPAFVVITLALGLGAHAVAGGGPPSLGSALLIAVFVGIAGALFALREQSLPRLVALVWGVQAWIHLVLISGHQHGPGGHLLAIRLGGHGLHLAGLASGGAAVVVLPATPDAVTTVLPAQPVAGLGQVGAGAAAGAAPFTEGTNPLLMLAMHALAGLALAAWLRRGEAAVFRAARRILPRLLPRRRPLPVRTPVLLTLPVGTAPRVPRGRLLIRLTTPRRGPPPLFA